MDKVKTPAKYKKFEKTTHLPLDLLELSEYKDRFHLKAYSSRQFKRWLIYNLDSLPNNSADRYSAFFDFQKRVIENNCGYSVEDKKPSNIQLDLIDKLNIRSDSKEILYEAAPNQENLYYLSLINQFSNIVGTERFSKLLTYSTHVNIQKILDYCSCSFENILTSAQISDIRKAKILKKTIKQPQEISEFHSALVWIEKIIELNNLIHRETHNKYNSKRSNPAFLDFNTFTGKGFVATTFRKVKEPLGKEFKKLSPSHLCFICIDDEYIKNHETAQKELARFVNDCNSRRYVPYICDFRKNGSLAESDPKNYEIHAHAKYKDCYSLNMSLLENDAFKRVDQYTEQTFLRFSKQKNEYYNSISKNTEYFYKIKENKKK